MSECLHKNLVLIKEISNKLRCTRCHLTLTPEELGNSYCPECYESTGKKHVDFEKITLDLADISRYRCEDCGVIIKTAE
jgi:Zn finger protein HypA/HybF involved in hydrogenase expression